MKRKLQQRASKRRQYRSIHVMQSSNHQKATHWNSTGNFIKCASFKQVIK